MKLMALLCLGWLSLGIAQAQVLSWKEIQTPVKASLRGLSPVSDQVCWASGSGGTWLKTLDGGNTWQHGVIGGLDTVDFRSIHAFSDQIAVAASAGQPAVIYRTTDGGQSWKKVHQEGPEAFFDGISFVDPSRGYVLGDPVDGRWMILETVNGGESWAALSHLPQAEDGEAAFAASASSLLAREGSLVLGTGGSVSYLHFFDPEKKAWKKLKTPMRQGEPSQGIFAMAYSQNTLLAVGGDYTLPEDRQDNAFGYSEGSFWIPTVAPFGYRSGLDYLDERALFIAVGPSGSDYSRTGGISWENFSKVGYHSVKTSTDRKAIWASGSAGRVGVLIQR